MNVRVWKGAFVGIAFGGNHNRSAASFLRARARPAELASASASPDGRARCGPAGSAS